MTTPKQNLITADYSVGMQQSFDPSRDSLSSTEIAAVQALVQGAGNTPALAPFATAIPLGGTKRMPPTQVAGALTFTVSGTPAAGGICTLKLTANGVNIPEFPGIHWGGSAGWVNTAGTVNIVSVWNDGDVTYYSIAQHQSAPIRLPSLTGAIKTGSSAPGSIALTMSGPVGNSGSVDASQFVVSTTNGGAQTDTVSAASSSGSVVTLTTSRAVVSGDTTNISYTPHATAGLRLVDAAGNFIYSLIAAPVSLQTFIGILDGLGVSAAGAWSLRRLTSAYSGPLIRVTGTIQGAFDVGFNAATGDLDMTRLTGGAGETYLLNTVYDQSGGGRNQQTAATTQIPSLTLTGGPRTSLPVSILCNSSETIRFTGTNLESVYLTSGRQGSLFMVQNNSTSGPYTGSGGGTDNAGTNQWFVQFTTDNSTTPNNLLRGLTPTFVQSGAITGGFGVISAITTAGNQSTTRLVRTSSGVRQIVVSLGVTAAATVSGITRWGFIAGGTNGVNNRFVEQLQFATDVGVSVRDAVEDSQRAYWNI